MKLAIKASKVVTTTTERDLLSPNDHDIIYLESANEVQEFSGGVWRKSEVCPFFFVPDSYDFAGNGDVEKDFNLTPEAQKKALEKYGPNLEKVWYCDNSGATFSTLREVEEWLEIHPSCTFVEITKKKGVPIEPGGKRIKNDQGVMKRIKIDNNSVRIEDD